jgi:predicted S18 family serine protease
MFQLFSIIIVIILVVGGIASAVRYFTEEKADAQTPPTPTDKQPEVTGTITGSSSNTARVTVNPQITDSVTSKVPDSSNVETAPKPKAKKKRYYHSKPKAKKGSTPARIKSATNSADLRKPQTQKGK